MTLSILVPVCAVRSRAGGHFGRTRSADSDMAEEGREITRVSRIWRILYNIPGTIPFQRDESGHGGFRQSDMLHYGYYSLARPKGAGEEGFIVFQGSE